MFITSRLQDEVFAKDLDRGLASYAMVFVILCLYGLDMLTVSFVWSLGHYVFVENGQNLRTVFVALVNSSPPFTRAQWVVSVAGGISTLLADISLIWRCWTVWGRRWLVVLIPIACTLTGTAIKIVETYHLIHDTPDTTQDLLFYGSAAIWFILYISFLMATTIFCTLLIIYRIVSVSHGPGGMGIRLYRDVIEIIVESALIYSVSLLVYVILVARESLGGPYADVIASSARVCLLFLLFTVPDLTYDDRELQPTLIVGRVAAGHARPEESWNGSISSTSSLRFRRDSEDQREGTIDESDVEAGSEERR
ncbi:hypothetical protein EDD18DRAFT_1359595 [Armillaria luteobubalina]|uniref:Uncharacterized protein n=1 Tax=Armillaria luteobubalina TaxID=153913 RepID=A0AA39PR74_9AGAR|nr:hypothetical protein EDD18DRAFT_1359595 [Armillaria luteobubalina]